MAIHESRHDEAVFVPDHVDPVGDSVRHMGCRTHIGDFPVLDEDDPVGFVDHALLDRVAERIRRESQIRAADCSLIQFVSSPVTPNADYGPDVGEPTGRLRQLNL